MNAWWPLAIVLVAIASQLPLGVGEGVSTESCRSRDAVASTAPPDFLFATAEEWKRFALEAELDKRR
ncbi:MAG: hypothetical protein ACJ8GO_06950 [Ramlibacter sp.]